MKKLKRINPTEITASAFELIGSDWMLITAGNEQKFNTMTASWGGMGVIWNKNVSFIFIRPQRYTFEFAEQNDFYTLSFFDESHRKSLLYCGANSGRDVDKCAETGLVPLFDKDAPYFEQAKLVLVCKKLYAQNLAETFALDSIVNEAYSTPEEYHKMYIGEIIEAYVKED